jgi:hypothetical protein
MKILALLVSLLAVGSIKSSTAYSIASINALSELATTTNATTVDMINLKGCDYTSTTEAITESAKISDGSACPSADSSISNWLMDLTGSITSVTQQLVSQSGMPGSPGSRD